jgi:hypothetical protein
MESSSYKITYDADADCVVMKWDGYSTSSEFRQGTETMLNMVIFHHTNYVLADIENMVLISQEDQQWLEREFIPRAINFGFGALAIIKPKSYFNKVAIETISYKVDPGKLPIRFFDKIEEAKDWLKSIHAEKNQATKVSKN